MVLLPGCVCCGCPMECSPRPQSASIRFTMPAFSANMLTSTGPFTIYQYPGVPFFIPKSPPDLLPISLAAIDETLVIDLTRSVPYSVTTTLPDGLSYIKATLTPGTASLCASVNLNWWIQSSGALWVIQKDTFSYETGWSYEKNTLMREIVQCTELGFQSWLTLSPRPALVLRSAWSKFNEGVGAISYDFAGSGGRSVISKSVASGGDCFSSSASWSVDSSSSEGVSAGSGYTLNAADDVDNRTWISMTAAVRRMSDPVVSVTLS